MDGLGYVLLHQLFTAHITGNTVKTGTDLAQVEVSRALVDGFPIAVFVLGAFAGALLRDLLARRMVRPRIPVLALEAGRAPPLLAGLPVRTFMTGTMVDLGDTLAASAMAAGTLRRERLHRAGLLFTVWFAYLAGAAAVGAAALRVGTWAALAPACGIGAALALESRTR